jgi:hypothetical protein
MVTFEIPKRIPLVPQRGRPMRCPNEGLQEQSFKDVDEPIVSSEAGADAAAAAAAASTRETPQMKYHISTRSRTPMHAQNGAY